MNAQMPFLTQKNDAIESQSNDINVNLDFEFDFDMCHNWRGCFR